MTNIQFLKDRIIIDGHAETKEQCETITLLCDNLAKSKDFKTVRYKNGYAEFEKISNAKELKFFAPTEEADITLIWDSGIISVTGVPNDTGGSYTWTASNTAKTVTAIFGDYETITYTPVLKDGYVIDTVTTNNDGSSAADTINIANDKKSFAVSLLYPNQYGTITITTKQTSSSGETWVFNEKPTLAPYTQNTIKEQPFKSNNIQYKAIKFNKTPFGYPVDAMTIEYVSETAIPTGNTYKYIYKFKDVPNFDTQYTITLNMKFKCAEFDFDNLKVFNKGITYKYANTTKNIQAYQGKGTQIGWKADDAKTIITEELTTEQQNFLNTYATYIGEYQENNTIKVYDTTTAIWTNNEYRTIKFKEEPTGDLLTWLQANGTKQATPTTKQQIDLSKLSGWTNLASGQHSITVKAKASGYADSASSNAVSVEKAASGHAVTITAAAGSYGVKIYDGTSSSGTLLGTVNDDATGGTAQSKIVNCSSGNLYLISDNGAYTDANTIVTGGVTIVSEGSYNYDGTFNVTADGTITISLACLIEGTQITLAGGTTKAIEDITYDDELLVWNFYKGKFDTAKPTWIKVAEVAPRYNLVKFSNGAEVGFVGAGGEKGYHRIFNKEAGAFTHTGCKDTPNGTTTFAQDKTFPTVVSQEVVEKEVKFYNVITDKHYNLFANGILTSCKLSNEYNIKDMKYVGEKLINAKEKDAYFEKIKKTITFKSTRE